MSGVLLEQLPGHRGSFTPEQLDEVLTAGSVHVPPTTLVALEQTHNLAGGAVWPLAGYAAEGPRVTNWMADGVVKHHRRLDTYVRLLRAAGFALADLVEWTPSAADLATHPDWGDEVHRPAFLLVGATAL